CSRLFFNYVRHPPGHSLSPYTTLFRSVQRLAGAEGIRLVPNADLERAPGLRQLEDDSFDVILFTEIIEHITFNPVEFWRQVYRVDRKSTRLNSSHVKISYAVFCLTQKI